MAMKDLVISVLDDANVSRIAFRFGPVNVSSTGYAAVKTAVDAGRIGAIHVPALGAANARYEYTPNNRFKLGYTALGGSADRKALLLHEATHAIYDLNSTQMKQKESEAGAYIAQCMFFYYLNEAALQGGATPTFSGQPILTAAWPIAMAARTTPGIPEASLAPLYTAIANDHSYDAEANVPYDG
jgi:hypothetical protein